MEPENSEWFSSTANKLNRLVDSAAIGFERARGDEESLHRETRKFLIEIGAHRFKGHRVSVHLWPTLRIALSRAGFNQAEIAAVVRDVTELIAPGRYHVVIHWAAANPTNREILSVRELVPSLGEMSVIECKRLIDSSDGITYGRYEKALEAELAKECVEKAGFRGTIEKENA